MADLLKKTVGDFKSTLPIVSCLRAPGLKARHWDQIHKIAGFEIEHQNLTMAQLMERGITEKVEQIEIIATEAINESALQNMLAKVASDWKDMDFEYDHHKRTGERKYNPYQCNSTSFRFHASENVRGAVRQPRGEVRAQERWPFGAWPE